MTPYFLHFFFFVIRYSLFDILYSTPVLSAVEGFNIPFVSVLGLLSSQ
jgi:hypothetical protein